MGKRWDLKDGKKMGFFDIRNLARKIKMGKRWDLKDGKKMGFFGAKSEQYKYERQFLDSSLFIFRHHCFPNQHPIQRTYTNPTALFRAIKNDGCQKRRNKKRWEKDGIFFLAPNLNRLGTRPRLECVYTGKFMRTKKGAKNWEQSWRVVL